MKYIKKKDEFALNSNPHSRIPFKRGGRRGRARMVVCFITTYAISAYHHFQSCELESHSWRGVLDTTLCDKVCQVTCDRTWFSQGTPVSSTNKTDRHYTTEILLKMVLNTLTLTLPRASFS
jgi:hypothetical protein